ncbi:mechanosensitive ion channel family protein [Endozoicomonas sp. OPT23]|uniref:mechanosensitive ion channel family protein n=1 Tax=Endozoicomonas sp. OPT23 TaxID=2072845 RepID=UPI00189173D3|nr:mechanosensitive ion channel family protein [Endozoicomonas sp. OPT23]
MGLSVVAHLSLTHLGIEENPQLAPARKVILVLLLYAFLVRYLHKVRRSFYRPDSKNTRIDKASLEFILKLLQIGLTLAMTLTLLQNLGISISGLLTFGGVGALAVGLAARDMLANLFGGLTLYIDRPFSIGDKVGLIDKKIEGFVEYIGWRQTRIRGYDRTPVYVPNALFASTAVLNPSRMTHRRISVVVGLRYQDFKHITDITEEIDRYLDTHPAIDPMRDNIARFSDFGSSSLDILVRCYPVITDWKGYMTVRHEILIKIGEIIHKHGADFAFPTRTLEFSGNDEALLKEGSR